MREEELIFIGMKPGEEKSSEAEVVELQRDKRRTIQVTKIFSS